MSWKVNLQRSFSANAWMGKYKFETQANNSTAKTPMGAFEEFEIDNDIVTVIKALEEF